MPPPRLLLFPPFRLDPVNERLWCEMQEIPLRPKTFAVLRYLVEHPEQLVTKEELLSAVWPETYVSDVVPMGCIRDLRKVLGDDAKEPRFIQTVHRRGYRFIAAVTTAPRQSLESRVQRLESKYLSTHLSEIQSLDPRRQTLDVPLVGREAELRQLHSWLQKALYGKRQIVFVTGEPGIGKTTIVEAFLSQLVPEEKVWIGRGQCIEHYGAGEAYMPVLEALGRLCRASEGEQLIDVLSQYAPTWLVQLPALLKAEEFERLQRKVQEATHERMLREMAEAVEALTAERPLILCLEDLHWSDVSTLELLSVLARRQERARLLVLGTYRPVEMLGNGHPLRAIKQELQLHQQCKELRLGFLTEQNVAEYLRLRFAAGAHRHAPLQQLARTIHQRTEGNPLFMVNVVDYMTAQGMLGELGETRPVVQVEVPENIHQMIEKQLDRLTPEEQRVLEVASVAGVQFSAAAVAAGAKMTTGDVEMCCTGLARRELFLRTTGVSEWPDGTVATRYHFLHALYQEVLYERVPVGQRISLHKWIGERLERGYREHRNDIATELAVHFEQGHEYRRAVQYLQQAGENAVRRSAHQEAISHLSKGLELLTTWPTTLERIQQELTLRVALGPALMATKGLAAPEVGTAYTRARTLCQQVGETPQLFPVLWGLCLFYLVRAELEMAHELGEQLLRLAQRAHDSVLLARAHTLLGSVLDLLGEFVAARAHLERGLALYDSQQHHSLFVYGFDPQVYCLSRLITSLWALGYPDQALQRSQEALTLAQELAHPHSLAFALGFTAELHQRRRDRQAAQAQAEALISLSTDQGLSLWLPRGIIIQGWVLSEQRQGEEGIAQIRQGLTAYRTTGAMLWRSYHIALLAEACRREGQTEEGLTVLAEALAHVDRSGEHHHEAELHRLKGELTLQQESQKSKVKGQKAKIETSPQPLAPNTQATVVQEAEEGFLKAIEVARKQQAKSFELRATMSLARLWKEQGKKSEARQILAEVYGWFTEGFDTKDLQEAKALLEELH